MTVKNNNIVSEQVYDNYTSNDYTVWKILYTKQDELLNDIACSEWLKGKKEVSFCSDEIPNFQIINKILSEKTGWEIVCVPSIVPDDLFFKLLSEKKFPATSWLRDMSQLEYLEEPDMFHDVYAHVPLLVNHHFTKFLEELAKIALKYIDRDDTIHNISRVYWYSVEFGLIRYDEEIKIYGAGILSSNGESKYCLDDTKHRKYDIYTIWNTAYVKDKFQEVYFVIDSYEQLFNSIKDLERLITHE
jgi:phenylalanine-4-hydroxylase